eukprot:TRINITY_DN17865_c0_g1_i2.p1 TRINITY_DN17865_c0_g1~~TRINITY_DN17865_c0_g1_i2.p1  ORF type:complete len:682 (+),score=71.61 TRINITY_DN17865_c0_g1_i2:71-2047(+)
MSITLLWIASFLCTAVALDLTIVESYPPDDLQPLVYFNGTVLFKADSALDQVLYSDQGMAMNLADDSGSDGAEVGLVTVDCSIVSYLVTKLGGIYGDNERLLLLCSDGLKLSDGIEVELIVSLDAGNIFRPHFLTFLDGVVYLIHESSVYFLDPMKGSLSRAVTGSHANVRLPDFLKYPSLINADSRLSHKFLLTVLPQAGISLRSGNGPNTLLYPDSLCSVHSFTPNAELSNANFSVNTTTGNYGEERMIFSAQLDLECMKYNQEGICKMRSYWCSWDPAALKCTPNECFATAISGSIAAFSFRLYATPFDNRDAYISEGGSVAFPVEEQQINSMTRTSTGDLIFVTDTYTLIGGIKRDVIRGAPHTFIDDLEHIIEVTVSATEADWYIVRYTYSSGKSIFCSAYMARGFSSVFIPVEIGFSASTSTFGIPKGDNMLPPQATYAHNRVYFWMHLPSQEFDNEPYQEKLELWSCGVDGGMMSKKPTLHYVACNGVCSSRMWKSMLVMKEMDSKLVVVLPADSHSPGRYDFFLVTEKIIFREDIDPDWSHWSIIVEGVSTLVILVSAASCVKTAKKIETEAYLSPGSKPSTKVELKLKSFYQRTPNLEVKGRTTHLDEQLVSHPAGAAQQKTIWENIPTFTSFQTEQQLASGSNLVASL